MTSYLPRRGRCGSSSILLAERAACWPKRRTTCENTTRAAKLYVYGQDYNKRAFATAASDMLMKTSTRMAARNKSGLATFLRGQVHWKPDDKFDYLLANPPFGVDWKRQQKEIEEEHDKLGLPGASAPGCRASTMARCCSFST